MLGCEIEQARASNDCSFFFSNSSLAFDFFPAKSILLGTFSILAIHIHRTFAYLPSSLFLGISMIFALDGSHTTPPPICVSMASLSACTYHGIVFVLLLEYFWHASWALRSFAMKSFLDLSYSLSLFFLYRTSKVSFTTFVVFIITILSSYFTWS
jgi:hypothetical protein